MVKLSKKSDNIKVLEDNKCIILSGFGSEDIISVDVKNIDNSCFEKKILIPSQNSAFTIVSKPKKESFFSFMKKKLLFYPF